jgi:hypothetical protein
MTSKIAIVSDTSEAQLNFALANLQESASLVSAQLRSSNMALYEHLAKLWGWWYVAQSVPGYLDAEYAKVTKRRPKSVRNGINFTPLFRLTWGYNNGLSDDKCRRWSIVLNKLNALYLNEEQYRTDTVAKFQNYIHRKGGVDGFIDDTKFSPTEIDDDELSDAEIEAKQNSELPRLTTDEMLARLFEKAKAFYGAVRNPSTVDLNATIPATDDGLSMVLVRKIGDQYQLIGASKDEDFIKPVAMQTYLNDFSALPWSTQALIETLSTQCLPVSLQSFYAALMDVADSKEDKDVEGKRLKSVRRLLYLHATGEFVLSPIRAVSGVVTVAKPMRPVLDKADKDVFLTTRSRRALETKQISGRNFNLYSPSNAQVILTYATPNLASHVLRLQDDFEAGNFLHIDFWPFYANTTPVLGQVIVDDKVKRKSVWHAALNLAWLRKFAVDFTAPWIASHGTHIKREHQNIMRLTFATQTLQLDFVYRDGQFETGMAVDFANAKVLGSTIAVHVMTKDFVVATQAIADLGINTAIDVHVDADAVVLSYRTTAANYKVYVPTCTLDGVRSSKYFKKHTPTSVAELEDYNDQAEGDFDPE